MSRAVPTRAVQDAVGSTLRAAGHPEPTGWRRLSEEARHDLWRVSCGKQPMVVKVYRQQVDRYFHHRWRREERALDLVARHAPGLAPRPHGALLVPGAWAALAMDDLEAPSLADRLPQAKEAVRAELLELALAALRRFREVTGRFAGMFRALAYQSDLDRITRATLQRRYAIAIARLRDPQADPAPDADPSKLAPEAAWRAIDAGLIRPLLRGPRRVIHNGFSPLNLIDRGGRMAVVDWETIGVAVPEFDLADLLTFPAWRLAPEDMEARAAAAAGRPGDPARASPQRFWAAAAERSLTYAATSYAREARYAAGGRPELATGYAQRRAAYLATFAAALLRADLPAADRRQVAESIPEPTVAEET